ncbi:MAG: DsrH/TusB family sulfur metabolism protein [Spongiibacter sp.]|uniref:Protein TusB n=1 Tax=Spongiibacter thalassae TaxID=2721624 RepID=A0ABX1GDS6_9GAMM|nr:hypothetical protein [Spongiibacter thalassae]NKI17308.1 hypothetical protein [Spongiibacter thalassae]
MILHIIQSSEGFRRGLALFAEDDTLALLGEAVTLLNHPTTLDCLGRSVYALATELEEFSIAPHSGIKAIDYSVLIDLCEQHSHCLSW